MNEAMEDTSKNQKALPDEILTRGGQMISPKGVNPLEKTAGPSELHNSKLKITPENLPKTQRKFKSRIPTGKYTRSKQHCQCGVLSHTECFLSF